MGVLLADFSGHGSVEQRAQQLTVVEKGSKVGDFSDGFEKYKTDNTFMHGSLQWGVAGLTSSLQRVVAHPSSG